ncbi:MAG: hypothetical protein KAT70_00065 [Thermoplasmata archaeon]|nr:hypothetical protein [Thermoplasmata archaeon]
MRTHSINDITDIAIMKVTEGENPKPAIKLMNDISEITWKAGIDTEHDSDEAPQNVMEYYADEQEMVTA